jgi:hypothetical protein
MLLLQWNPLIQSTCRESENHGYMKSNTAAGKAEYKCKTVDTSHA